MTKKTTREKNFTHDITTIRAHTPTKIGVYRENQRLEQESTLERDIADINGLGVVVDRGLSRFRVPCGGVAVTSP